MISRVLATDLPSHVGAQVRLTGADNVRRVTLFPRDLHRLTP